MKRILSFLLALCLVLSLPVFGTSASADIKRKGAREGFDASSLDSIVAQPIYRDEGFTISIKDVEYDEDLEKLTINMRAENESGVYIYLEEAQVSINRYNVGPKYVGEMLDDGDSSGFEISFYDVVDMLGISEIASLGFRFTYSVDYGEEEFIAQSIDVTTSADKKYNYKNDTAHSVITDPEYYKNEYSELVYADKDGFSSDVVDIPCWAVYSEFEDEYDIVIEAVNNLKESISLEMIYSGLNNLLIPLYDSYDSDPVINLDPGERAVFVFPLLSYEMEEVAESVNLIKPSNMTFEIIARDEEGESLIDEFVDFQTDGKPVNYSSGSRKIYSDGSLTVRQACGLYDEYGAYLGITVENTGDEMVILMPESPEYKEAFVVINGEKITTYMDYIIFLYPGTECVMPYHVGSYALEDVHVAPEDIETVSLPIVVVDTDTNTYDIIDVDMDF